MKNFRKLAKKQKKKLAPQEAIITVHNLSKTFIVPAEKRNTLKDTLFNLHRRNPKRVFKVLDNVSFSVKKGEFFGIIGRNGSGKSTLLKILAQIYKADSGSNLHVKGRISPFLELGVGFTPEMTARENVYLNAAILGLSKAQIDERFDAIIQFAELAEFVDQKLKFFSSGMQVRLAFAVAIQADSDIILLDEVLAVGDASFQQKCFDTFRQFRKAGKTIIFVSHDLEAIRQFCNRVIYLKDGNIAMIGDPNKVIEHYLYTDKESSTEKVVQNKKNNESVEKKLLVDIVSVTFIDKFGHENSTFVSGDDIIVKVGIQSEIEVKDPNFGFIIYDDKDNYLFGSNTEIKNTHLPNLKPGYNEVIICLAKITLLKGKFFLTMAIGDMKYTVTHVWKDKAYCFYVNPASRVLGIFDMPYNYN
ncbi:MAG: ABC transporter ATP-binding protein [Candidatus Abawacabacteria bacterium]|nr:ABC transporter ATP-binding protein [Candidatus Abawacabacteria bacterium]